MGGFGSGSRGSKKGVAEHCYSIDTVSLKRWNLLVPGTSDRAGAFEWRRGSAEKPSSSVSYRLTVWQTAGSLRLIYSIKSQNADFDYAIGLVTTPCHLGGARWWFTCPLSRNDVVCGHRVRKLYLQGKYFGCRRCHNLTYTSSQQSDSRVYALLNGGLDPSQFSSPSRMSVTQLGLALKALALEQQRLDRMTRRFARKVKDG